MISVATAVVPKYPKETGYLRQQPFQLYTSGVWTFNYPNPVMHRSDGSDHFTRDGHIIYFARAIRNGVTYLWLEDLNIIPIADSVEIFTFDTDELWPDQMLVIRVTADASMEDRMLRIPQSTDRLRIAIQIQDTGLWIPRSLRIRWISIPYGSINGGFINGLDSAIHVPSNAQGIWLNVISSPSPNVVATSEGGEDFHLSPSGNHLPNVSGAVSFSIDDPNLNSSNAGASFILEWFEYSPPATESNLEENCLNVQLEKEQEREIVIKTRDHRLPANYKSVLFQFFTDVMQDYAFEIKVIIDGKSPLVIEKTLPPNCTFTLPIRPNSSVKLQIHSFISGFDLDLCYKASESDSYHAEGQFFSEMFPVYIKERSYTEANIPLPANWALTIDYQKFHSVPMRDWMDIELIYQDGTHSSAWLLQSSSATFNSYPTKRTFYQHEVNEMIKFERGEYAELSQNVSVKLRFQTITLDEINWRTKRYEADYRWLFLQWSLYVDNNPPVKSRLTKSDKGKYPPKNQRGREYVGETTPTRHHYEVKSTNRYNSVLLNIGQGYIENGEDKDYLVIMDDMKGHEFLPFDEPAIITKLTGVIDPFKILWPTTEFSIFMIAGVRGFYQGVNITWRAVNYEQALLRHPDIVKPSSFDKSLLWPQHRACNGSTTTKSVESPNVQSSVTRVQQKMDSYLIAAIVTALLLFISLGTLIYLSVMLASNQRSNNIFHAEAFNMNAQNGPCSNSEDDTPPGEEGHNH